MSVVTNSWTNDKPEGSQSANLTDDFLRQWRLDNEERLKEMFYGFNADSNIAPENEAGIKKLKLFPQSASPTTDSGYGFIFAKTVAGVIEVFYKDGNGNEIQLTSAGNLKATNNLIVDGTSTLTGNVTASGKLDVIGNIDPTSYETTNGGFIDEDSMATDSAVKVASQQSIKAYVDNAKVPFARAYSSGTQSINTGAWTSIEYDTDSGAGIAWDASNIYNTVNFRITPAVEGYYLVTAQLTIADLGTGKGVGIRIEMNGTTEIATSTQSGSIDADILPGCNVSDVVFFDSDDYILIQAFQNSGSAKNLAGGRNATYVTIHRI